MVHVAYSKWNMTPFVSVFLVAQCDAMVEKRKNNGEK